MSMLLRYMVSPEYIDTIRSLNYNNNNDGNDSLFISRSMIMDIVIPGIIGTIILLTIIYYIMITIVSYYYLDNNNVTISKRRQFAYQMTSLICNFGLGCSGLYYDIYIQPTYNVTVQETIQSFHHYLLFSYIQLGFNLWALPLCFLKLVYEEKTMMIHHFSIILVSIMSCFLHNGFRYRTPFFYGTIELSSVPLAIMNSYKENPIWIHDYPQQYFWIRLLFAFSFILIRIILLVPRMGKVLIDMYILLSYSNIILYQIFMILVWFSCFALLLLQVLWGSIIIKNLLKHFVPGLLGSSPKKKNKSKKL